MNKKTAKLEYINLNNFFQKFVFRFFDKSCNILSSPQTFFENKVIFWFKDIQVNIYAKL